MSQPERPPASPQERDERRSPLAYPAFRALQLASVVSYTGTFVQDVGERWLILDLTNSPAAAAMIATALVTSSLIAMLPSGILADRVDRTKLVVVAQLWQMGVAAFIGVASWRGSATPAVLILGAGTAGLGLALSAPAWSALVSEMVPSRHVAEAVTLNAAAFNIARAIGPAVGGLILAWLGPPATFFLNAASYAAVVVALLVHRPKTAPRAPKKASPPLLRAFAEPFTYATRDRGIRSVIGSMLVFTAGASFFYALAPSFAKITLAAGPRAYGLVLGAMGVGALVGALSLKSLRARTTPNVLVAASMLLFGACTVILSRVSTIAFAIVVFVPAGAGWVASFSSLAALVQVWTRNRIRATMMAIYLMVHLGAWAVGSFVSGQAAERWGVREMILTGGVLCLLAGLATFKLPFPRSFSAEGALESDDADAVANDKGEITSG